MDRRNNQKTKVVETRMLFIILVILTIVVVLFAIVLLNLDRNIVFPEKPIGNAQFVEFDSLLQQYHETLSKIPSPKYKDSNVFIDYGPPVGEVTSKNVMEGGPRKTKTILTWTAFYGKVNWMPKIVTCEGKQFSCIVTTNKNDLLKSDAVVFHPIDLRSYPQQRLPHQRWVYLVLEPPYLVKAFTRRDFHKYNGIFNWTSTYRWDSDIPDTLYNATVLKKPQTEDEYQENIRNITRQKRKLLAIMHRNCHPQSKRFEILAEIRRYLPVDFYGKCGNLECPRHTKKCKETMSAYKFYLSFENSECRDYVTEKVLHPLTEWQAVPIVFGAHPQDYAKIMPPNSYIDLKGFSSIEKLAEYITLLDKQPVLYEKYHAWRRTHTVDQTNTQYPNMCKFCEALFDPSLPVKTYRDFKGWYEEDICWPFPGNKLS